MIKILIVEDEPLVQVGIQSMLTNIALEITICGIANDGLQALELIEKFSPDLVISDIKMPRMNGLELLRESRDRFGELPVFIILTSYEDFHYLKEAMKYQVIDYLIKLELNKDNFTSAIQKALTTILKVKDTSIISMEDTVATFPFHDKYFIKLP